MINWWRVSRLWNLVVKFWFPTQNDEDDLLFSHYLQAQWNTTLQKHTNISLKSTVLCYPHKVSLKSSPLVLATLCTTILPAQLTATIQFSLDIFPSWLEKVDSVEEKAMCLEQWLCYIDIARGQLTFPQFRINSKLISSHLRGITS